MEPRLGCVASGDVFPLFAIASAELRRLIGAAQHQHPRGENRAAFYQYVGGEVHLVVERSIESGSNRSLSAVPVDDVSRDDARAAKTDADGFGSGRKLSLLRKIPYFLIDLLRHFIEPGIAFQHQSHVFVPIEDVGNRTKSAWIHQVVIAHEEAELASCFLN